MSVPVTDLIIVDSSGKEIPFRNCWFERDPSDKSKTLLSEVAYSVSPCVEAYVKFVDYNLEYPTSANTQGRLAIGTSQDVTEETALFICNYYFLQRTVGVTYPYRGYDMVCANDIDGVAGSGGPIDAYALTIGGTYYVRPYIIYYGTKYYGTAIPLLVSTFPFHYDTHTRAAPSVEILEVTDTTVKVRIRENTTYAGYTDGGTPITEFGARALTESTYTDFFVADSGTWEDYTVVISGLNPGTKYQIKPVATNSFYVRKGANYEEGLTPSVTTLKETRPAPSVPTANNITQNSFTLSSDAGSKIVCNGQTKNTGSTWTGLSAGMEYSAYAYFPETGEYERSPNSNEITIKTLDKFEQDAPSAPVASNITGNSVKLSSDPNSTISCNNEEKLSGSTWTGLSLLTDYIAYAYFAETKTHKRSPNSETTIFTTPKMGQAAPQSPIASNITKNSVTLTSSVGSLIVCNDEEKPSGSTWVGLTVGTNYAAYAYFPETEEYSISPNSAEKIFRTLEKSDQVAPSIPEAILVTGNSISLQSDTGAMIECNGQTKISGSTWSGLQPITAYTAKAYMPETETHKRSPYSGEVTVTTTKLSQAAPQQPIGTELTARSVILTSSPGSMIICDGQEKPSGSLFLWLNPDMVYRAYAYFPETANKSRSPNSLLCTFTTLEEPVDEEVVVFGILSNGTPAPSQYLQGMTITASNDCVEIKDGQILAVKPGYCTITFMIGDITTYMDVVVQ